MLLLPPVNEAYYLVELWHQAGTVESSGMGISRLSWQEISAWLNVRRIMNDPELLSWEIEIVKHLSEEYSSEYSLASDKDRQPPYTVESIEQIDRAAISSKVSNVLAGFKKSKDTPKYEVE